MRKILLLIIFSVFSGAVYASTDAKPCEGCERHVTYEFDGVHTTPLAGVEIDVTCASPKFIHGFNYSKIGHFVSDKHGVWYLPKKRLKKCFGVEIKYTKPGYKLVNNVHYDESGHMDEVRAMAKDENYNLVRVMNISAGVHGVVSYPKVMAGFQYKGASVYASKYAIKYDFDYEHVYEAMETAQSKAAIKYVKNEFCDAMFYLWRHMSGEEKKSLNHTI